MPFHVVLICLVGPHIPIISFNSVLPYFHDQSCISLPSIITNVVRFPDDTSNTNTEKPFGIVTDRKEVNARLFLAGLADYADRASLFSRHFGACGLY